MKHTLLFCVMALCCGFAQAKVTRLSLSEALKSQSVTLEATNFEGKYQGKTTRLKVTNKKDYPVIITVDIGTILTCSDTGHQPMVLAGAEMVTVPPNISREVEVNTFCGNLSRRCPAEGSKYVYRSVADDSLVKVLKFIKANDLFSYIGQAAVWAMTNNCSISDVFDSEKPEVSRKLVTMLMSIKHQPMPDIFNERQLIQESGEQVVLGKPLKIVADFTVRLTDEKVLTLGVFNDKNEMIQEVFTNKTFQPMGHQFGVEFTSSSAPPGPYYIRLKEKDVVLQEKKVMVE